MAYVLLVFGALFLTSSVRNTQQQVFTLLKGDFSGNGNFLYWFVAILIVGSVGYVQALRGISNALLALIIIVLFLSKQGFFNAFSSQLNQITSGASPSANLLTPGPLLTPLGGFSTTESQLPSLGSMGIQDFSTTLT